MKFAVELAQILAVLFAAIGLFFTGFQMWQANKQRRISRVDDARKEFYSNKLVQDLYYRIEYDQFEYGKDFHESPDEKTLDYMLSIFDALAKQIEMGLLSERDLELMSYEYRVVYRNSEMEKYFAFLDDWYNHNELPSQAFKSFRNIGSTL